MQNQTSLRPHLPWPVLVLGTALVYSVVGAVSFWLATPPGYATILWPSSGLALAGALIYGVRIFPGIFLGAWLITLWITLTVNAEATLPASLIRLIPVGIGAVGQAWLGAVLIRRYAGFPVSLDQSRHIALFLLLGGPVSCCLNATVAAVTMWGGDPLPFALRFTNWWSWWLGDTVGVWFVAPFLLIWTAEPRALWQKRSRSIVMPLALVCAVVVFVSLYTRIWRHERLEHTFNRQAQTIATTLEQSLAAYVEVVQTIEQLYVSVPMVGRHVFHTFVQKTLERHPGLQALQWIPRVRHADRSVFETHARQAGFAAFRIREQRESGRLMPAADQAEYFPVFYVEPYRGNESALGFDLASEPARRTALETARDTGQAVMTVPVTLVGERPPQLGSLIVVPIYHHQPLKTVAERRQHLRGFALGVVRIGEMVQSVVPPLDQSYLAIQLYHPADGRAPQLLFGEPAVNPANLATLEWRTSLSTGDRPWSLVVTATPAFLSRHQPWLTLVALDSGLLLSAILIGTLLILTGRTETLAQTNVALTREIRERQETETALRESEGRFRSVVEGSLQGIVIHQDELIQYVNPAALDLFGYSHASDLLGRSLFQTLADERARASLYERTAALLRGESLAAHAGWLGVRQDGRRIWITSTASVTTWHGQSATVSFMSDITNQKQSLDALRESETRLRQIAETIAEFVWISDPHLPRHLYVSPVYETIWGRSCESLYDNPLSWLEAIHPEDQEIGRGALATLHRGEPSEVEYRILRPDGSIRWVRDRGFPIMDSQGQVDRLTGVAEDITAQKEAETELRQSYAHFHALLENSADIICVLDAQGVVQYYSPSVERVLDYRPEDVIGRHVYGALHPDDVAHIQAAITTLANHPGQTQRLEYQARHRDGSWHDFEAMLSSPSGGLLRGDVVVNARDVTQRKQAERELLQSEGKFRDLVEGSLQGISVSRHGRRVFVNTALARIFGYERAADLIGQDIRELIAPSEQARLAAYQQARSRGEPAPVHYELQGVKKDGTSVWVETTVSVIDWEGEAATMTTLIDITERRQVEAERQRLEAQLRQSQKMEAVGTLAAGIAHDFNNVLGAIFINTEVAKSFAQPDTSIQESLANILSAAGRAKDLVQQILTFSRQVEGQRRPVRLTSVIQETMTLLRASLPTTIDIRQSLPEEGDLILADPTQLHQIVLNLCVNAEHAMRETGGTLEIKVDAVDLDAAFVRSHPDLQPGPHVRLTVRDSGHGMTPEVMERIFDPFYTTKDVGEGTGMGLAMVHGMVASHDGSITVDSKPSNGTTFTLLFPCVQGPVDDHNATQDVISPGAGCIMVVDDEPMLARGMKAVLTRCGYEVEPYTSSQEALAAFEAYPERFDLVITDQTMPEMTGDQLARDLRQCRSDIPIILCTGYSHVMNATKAQQQGIDAFCIKPLDMRELRHTIERVLGHRRDVE